MADHVRRRNIPPESEEDYDDVEMHTEDDFSRSPYSTNSGSLNGPKRRQVKFAAEGADNDLYASEYAPDGRSVDDGDDTMSRQSTLSRHDPGMSRQNSMLSRNVSMLSRSSTFKSLYSRTNTIGKTLRRMTTGRFDFETEEEVEEAAQHLEEMRRQRLDSGEGHLERMTTMMMARTETLARHLTMPLEFVRQKTMQRIKDFKEIMDSEEMQEKLKSAKVSVMHISTGRPAWHPEPAKVPLPSSFNLCTFFIIAMALVVPLLFFLSSSRDKVMDVVARELVGEKAGPGLPPLTLPELGQVCSSGGFAQQGLHPGSPTLDSTWWSTALGDGAQIQLQSVSGGYWWSPSPNPTPIAGTILSAPPPPPAASTTRRLASTISLEEEEEEEEEEGDPAARGRRLLQTEVREADGKATDKASTASPPPPPRTNSGEYRAWGEGPIGLFTTETPPTSSFLTVVRVNSSAFHLRAPNGMFLTPTTEGDLVAVTPQKLPAGVFTITAVDKKQAYLQTYDGSYVAWGSADGYGRLRVVSSPSDAANQLGLQQSEETYSTFYIREVMQVARIRGVNLGGWLLVEEWMSPQLYDPVPDLIDGWQVQLQSATTGRFLTTWQNNYQVHSDNEKPGDWETWHVRRLNGSTGALQLRNRPTGFYLSADNGGGGDVWARSLEAGSNEVLVLHVSRFNPSQVMIQTASGQFLRASSDGSLTADAPKPGDFANPGVWGKETTFNLRRVTAVQGEWQVARWHPQGNEALRLFRSGFLTERDWRHMAQLGVNTARIPVGYWITQGDAPDWPFVGGGVAQLDKAFVLAEKYNIRIWLSMHAAPGGQNREHVAANRDGILDWGRPGGDSIQRTLDAIGWLADRYAKSKALFGIGVLNEPNVDMTAYTSLDALKQFHVDAYHIIRKYSPCCYVCISGFVGGKEEDLDGHMVDPLQYNNVVLDVHYYTVFDPNTFGKLRADGIMEHVEKTWGQQIATLQQGGRTVLIGEWSLGLPKNAKAGFSHYKKFSRTQLTTYNNASAGWFFWSLKVTAGSTGFPNWSMEDAFQQGWLHY